MKKIIPAITTVTLAGSVLVSCNAPFTQSPVENAGSALSQVASDVASGDMQVSVWTNGVSLSGSAGSVQVSGSGVSLTNSGGSMQVGTDGVSMSGAYGSMTAGADGMTISGSEGSMTAGANWMTVTGNSGSVSTSSMDSIGNTDSTINSNSTADTDSMTVSKTVSYMSPAGNDTMKVDMVVSGGKITSVSVTPLATNEISLKLQKAFAEAVPGVAVGKDVQNFSLDTVSGASLTTEAFNGFVDSL